ncbi:MAG: type II toxin-antitoxin system RelE/ParE family toxin [Lachnospiraceae bacterium]|nr:type II toxin-antitoxin system RelE/ParE family toxin [Lachnospiraceae bacterium]
MTYKLTITEHADELLDNLMHHLLYRLKNEQAARHLLDGIENVYERLEENPLQFPLSRDAYLAHKGYHEAIVPQMEYIVVFSMKADIVNVVGIFHQLENYQSKM